MNNQKRKGADTIALYHCSIKIISRGKGESAVAAATYCAGTKITNERDGEIHDYTRNTEILLPEHAPVEYADRTILWNAVEKIEKANKYVHYEHKNFGRCVASASYL